MGFISKSIFEDIVSLVLQNRFADIEPMSDPQNEALFEILNPEDVFAIFNTDVDWPWKIDHIPVPSRSLPRIIFKKVSLSK